MGVRTLLQSSWRAPRAGYAATNRGRALAPQPAAAIRVPDRVNAQLAVLLPSAQPQIYVHEGARQALYRRLASAYVGPVALSITDNRHSIISHSRKDGILRARVHHMFLDAPPRVVQALVRYVTEGDRVASQMIGEFIDANGGRLSKRRRGIPLTTRGAHHDLLAIFEQVNATYFGGSVNALITWGKAGRPPGARSRRTIKLGSYAALDRLIRIHPVLDRPWVPRYFVSYVVYHEMLHHVIPTSRGEGRRLLHPPEFREREARFKYYERAVTWEHQHIGRLLRSR